MKGQWGLILGLLAAIVIAIFAVINVNGVKVNYLFGTAVWPLILVILGSVFMGAVIAGAVGMVRLYRLKGEVKRLKATKELLENQIATEEVTILDQVDQTLIEVEPISRKRYNEKPID